jgi:acyl-CoA thioesterase I
MACRIATTFTTRLAGALGAAFLGALIGLAAARAQTLPPVPVAPEPGADGAATLLTKACQPGAPAAAEHSPLPHVAAVLAKRKTLRILAMGAAPGLVGARGGYTELIESILESALKGVDVVMINRGVSGELAANAATRMKNEVALDKPDLVLWQVGTNDALAYVDADEFAFIVKDQIAWLKAHKVDVVLVGLQFAKEMLRDGHYKKIRDTLRRVAAAENVIVIRFYEAMQIINRASAGGVEPVSEAFERNEAGYDCLAEYVARAITLGVFAKGMPKRPAPQQPQ